MIVKAASCQLVTETEKFMAQQNESKQKDFYTHNMAFIILKYALVVFTCFPSFLFVPLKI